LYETLVVEALYISLVFRQVNVGHSQGGVEEPHTDWMVDMGPAEGVRGLGLAVDNGGHPYLVGDVVTKYLPLHIGAPPSTKDMSATVREPCACCLWARRCDRPKGLPLNDQPPDPMERLLHGFNDQAVHRGKCGRMTLSAKGFHSCVH
jgi:hypothetical protein